MAAVNAVFDTYELLEKILVELPIAAALTMTRVRKSYRAVFERSKEMRRKLFETELPGRNTLVNGIQVNTDKTTPWIFRTMRTNGFSDQIGSFFILRTPSTGFVVFCPCERDKDLVTSGVESLIEPIGDSMGWSIQWRTSDKVYRGMHWMHVKHYHKEILKAYLQTFHNMGDKRLTQEWDPTNGRWVARRQTWPREWSGATRIFE